MDCGINDLHVIINHNNTLLSESKLKLCLSFANMLSFSKCELMFRAKQSKGVGSKLLPKANTNHHREKMAKFR